MAFEFMRRAKENGYGKFGDIGVNANKVIEAARTSRPDLKVFFNNLCWFSINYFFFMFNYTILFCICKYI